MGDIKVPQQAQAAEDIILESILFGSIRADMCNLQEKHFYKESRKILWRVVKKLELDGSDVSQESAVIEYSKINKDSSWIRDLDGCQITSSPDYYISEIIKAYRLRSIAATSLKAHSDAFQPNANPDMITADLQKLSDDIGTIRKPTLLKNAIPGIFDRVEKNMSGDNKPIGVTTGLPKLDDLLGGLQPGKLILDAGRPGMGKSSLALQIALLGKKGDRKAKVLFINQEMGDEELCCRGLSMKSGISSFRIMNQKLTKRELSTLGLHANEVFEAGEHIYLYTHAGVTVPEIWSNARRMKAHDMIDLLMIDYLQILTPTEKLSRRDLEIQEMTRLLKLCAMSCDIPILLLSQLSRAAEMRDNKRHKLSDLRESGAIEQDADIVMFLPDLDERIIQVEKHRGGETGDVPVQFISKQTMFVEVDREHEEDDSPSQNQDFDKSGF